MAKVTVKLSKELAIGVRKNLTQLVKDDKLLSQIGKFIANRMRQQARLSKNMRTGRDLPNLSPRYRNYRQRVRRTGRVSGAKGPDSKFFRASSRKSNLTLTGKFLRGLKYIPMTSGRSRGEVIVAAKGRNRNGLTNAQVINFLIERDDNYNIFGLDAKAVSQVRKIVVRELRRRLKKR